MSEVVERTIPRISVNKLGEYMVASATRRRRIVADQKWPSGFIVTRYREATDAMIDFIEGGAQDEQIIYRAVEELMRKPTSTDFQEQDRELSIEALEAFLDLSDRLDLEDLSLQRGEATPPQMTVAGISISVRPDIIVTASSRNGRDSVGLMKLYLSKSHPLTDEAGSYIGAILQMYGNQFFSEQGAIDHRLCQVIDVFGGKVFNAPRAFQRRQNDVEAACQEIAHAWPYA